MPNSFKKVTLSPFVYKVPSIRQASYWILFVLSFQLIMLFITKSYQSLVIILGCTVASVLAEFLDNALRKRLLHFDFTSLIHGIIAGLFLPQNFPPYYAFVIVFIAVLITKYAFGGLGTAWANAVAVAIVIAYTTCPQYFPSFQITLDYLNQNTLERMIADRVFLPLPFDSNLTSFLNSKIFRYAGVSLPEGYLSLFWDNQAVIPAFRFNIITLLSSIILFSGNMINALIPCIYIFVYGLLVRLFVLLPVGGNFANGDILIALLTSGTLFTAFFLIQSYGTTPLSIRGKTLYGVFAGIIAFVLSGCGTSSVGSVFTVLIMNIVSPFIQIFEDFMYSSWLHSATEAKRETQNEVQYK